MRPEGTIQPARGVAELASNFILRGCQFLRMLFDVGFRTSTVVGAAEAVPILLFPAVPA